MSESHFRFPPFSSHLIQVGSDQTVDVGADLYEIDTEAEATLTEPAAAVESSSEKVSKTEAGKPPLVAAVSQESAKTHRTPSIHFKGKEGWERSRRGESVPSSSATQATSPGGAVNTIIVAIPPNYGRPKFTEEEMEALILGGANLSPDVKRQSGGAIFGY